MRHLSEEELARLAAGELGFLARGLASKHLGRCAGCSERLKIQLADNILVAEGQGGARPPLPGRGRGGDAPQAEKRTGQRELMSSTPSIPDFKLLSCCGSGAYGDVWIAEDHSGLRRALKILDRGRLERLGVARREEKALRLFRNNVPRHPNLIEIHHVGETAACLYYVMDLADNLSAAPDAAYAPDTLEARIERQGAFSVEAAKTLILELLDGLEALHQSGLAHRDIKPSNVLFQGGKPKLADIGLVTSDDSMLSVAGTAGFIPPEYSSGAEADLYAMGKLLYRATTGKEVSAFPSLAGLNGELKGIKHLNQVALKACAKKTGNRFRSAQEFRSALRHGLHVGWKAKLAVALAVALTFAAVMAFCVDRINISKPAAQSTSSFPKIARLLGSMEGEMSRNDLQLKMGLKSDDYFRQVYLLPALEAGYLEMTKPDKPSSPNQKYRLTAKGRSALQRPGTPGDGHRSSEP